MHRSVHNIANTSKQTISWLLVLALLSLTLFPYHYHLNHEEVASPVGIAAQQHAVDHHGALDLTVSDHQQDSHTVEPATDLTLKSSSVQVPLAILVLCLVILLPLSMRVDRLRIETVNQRLTQLRWYTTPPLRAPPLC